MATIEQHEFAGTQYEVHSEAPDPQEAATDSVDAALGLIGQSLTDGIQLEQVHTKATLAEESDVNRQIIGITIGMQMQNAEGQTQTVHATSFQHQRTGITLAGIDADQSLAFNAATITIDGQEHSVGGGWMESVALNAVLQAHELLDAKLHQTQQ